MQFRHCALLGLASVAVACEVAVYDKAGDSLKTGDSAFAAVQQRGQTVMGVDQNTSKHVFEDLPDGGRVVLDRDDASDTAAVRTIREHMRVIEAAFRRGDFTLPGAVHDREVPGTRVMAGKRALITYTAADRPRGAEVRISSGDASAVAAIKEFLAFQRSDHRAAGHD